MKRNETLCKIELSGDSGDRSNWQELFDSSVWTGNGYYIGLVPVGALWQSASNRWLIPAGTNKPTTAQLTPVGTDFDAFRPTKGRISFTGADTIDILIYFDTGLNLNSSMISGQGFNLATDLGKIIKIEFRRDDIYEIYPYVTNIEFYDADYVPNVLDDLILPISTCSINHQIRMKDSDGNDMPIWDSTANPGDNGYDLDKSKYVINFSNTTVPGEDYASGITARMNNDATLYISTQTINGEPDYQELITGIIESAIPDTGAMSRSIRISGKKEILLSDVIWDYQEIEITKINYMAPNQSDGKYTLQCPGIISGIIPGFKVIYETTEFLISEVQYIISSSGIQMYLKE